MTTSDKPAMRASMDCYPCFLRQAIQTARFAGADESQQEEILKLSLKELESMTTAPSPAEAVSQLQLMISEKTGNPDPYLDAKISGNTEALKWLPQLKEKLAQADDALGFALKTAAIGNIMDYGAFAQFDVSELLEKLHTTPFGISARQHLETQLINAKTLTYFTDNAGEIVFDKLLIEQLIDQFSLQRVRLVVRSAPFLNDVCESDARAIGLADIPEVEIINLQISPRDCDPSEFQSAIQSDVVITKGMANFENYGHRDDFFFIFIAKCNVIAKLLNRRSGKNISVGDWILYHSSENLPS